MGGGRFGGGGGSRFGWGGQGGCEGKVEVFFRKFTKKNKRGGGVGGDPVGGSGWM